MIEHIPVLVGETPGPEHMSWMLPKGSIIRSKKWPAVVGGDSKSIEVELEISTSRYGPRIFNSFGSDDSVFKVDTGATLSVLKGTLADQMLRKAKVLERKIKLYPADGIPFENVTTVELWVRLCHEPIPIAFALLTTDILDKRREKMGVEVGSPTGRHLLGVSSILDRFVLSLSDCGLELLERRDRRGANFYNMYYN